MKAWGDLGRSTISRYFIAQLICPSKGPCELGVKGIAHNH